MKVIFTQDVGGKGKKGKVKDVPVGYANNFLLRNKYVVEATPGSSKQLEQQNGCAEVDRQQEIDDTKVLKTKSEDIEAEVSVETGEGSKLFGFISTKQIADALENQHDIKTDKRKVDSLHGIHTLGYTDAPAKLGKEVEDTIRVHIIEE